MIEIKTLIDIADFKELSEIQKNAWGFDDFYVEPHHLMVRIQKYGGLIQGLFLDSKLIGFTMAIIGKWKGEYFIYSHMAAIVKEYQGKGFGFLLKKSQREEALKMGYNLIRWSFDPLELQNAYFNMHRLGVICDEYERNAYGEGESGLHIGLPTDRLVAAWDLKSERVVKKMAMKEQKTVVDISEKELFNFKGDIVYIEIPLDIRTLKRENMEKAVKWRMKTRELFETAFKKGFIAKDIVFLKNSQRVYFRLDRKK